MQEFSIVKRGYNPEEVDKYLGKLEQEIDSYKEKDTSIAGAILNAQVAADNIVKNAHTQSEEILQNTVEHLNQILMAVEKQKEVVRNLQEEYYELVNKYLKNAQNTDFLEIYSSINELENLLMSLKRNPNSPEEQE